ncbi:hypothetical protein PHYSODRAFT_539550 [Phytophthora sojae]|uniref:FAD dependent oxidoreductase domain-containing protein n=1 Tax=Phytophthora sojae (strain P6497) TaxID=1094619 RepID=G4YW57_PHYSP|nr:hypothetical protein PHYSODRAFT_539550 [Phytophthora sojae]EGZ24439.1 hypothetical protein PHYSODRAFT_539550 [Phytophthora sojae]|eukprot:XP_009519727.1 hypothetical protein PHYSODRAFT_539550 [Phytophthora sojae]
MTGELDFAFGRLDDIVLVEKTLKKYDVPFESLTGDQVNQRFPGFSLPDNSHAVYNPLAGVLNPTLAMATMQKLAQGLGASIRERSPVTDIVGEQQADGATLAVVTLADGTQVRGHQCIVTAGAWTNKVLKRSDVDKVKLQPIATFGTYWRCKHELYTPDKFPVFLKYGYPEMYGLPMMSPEEGVKICRHDGPDVNPDARQGVVQPAPEQEDLQDFVADNFSQVDSSAPNHVDHCMYTMTEDANFLIDFLQVPSGGSATKKIVVGAGFSGHGAKMTPVIGQMLADLALKGKTHQHPDGFRLSRKISAALEHHSFSKL